MTKRKHTEYTLAFKATILRRHIDGGEKINALANETGIPQNTISTWKQSHNKIFTEVAKSVQPTRKRVRLSDYPDVEKALLYWIRDMRSKDNPPPLSGETVCAKAESFATQLGHHDWHCSKGFFYRFCRRYAVVSKRICGESLDCPDTETFIEEVLTPLLGEYHPDNIYNADESAFNFKLLPQRTYAFKSERVYGGKTSACRDRLTLMMCTNMTGSDKLKPVVIGKAQKPQVLKRYNMSVNDLPVQYYANKNGWMTGYIFGQWLDSWNSKLIRQHKKVLLLIDNAPCHVVLKDYSNIRIQFLPPNTTSKMQPVDQGVLRMVKLYYRKLLAQLYLDGIENNDSAKDIMRKNLNLKVACDMVVKCWGKVKPSLIANCFRKAGFVSGVTPEEDPEGTDARPDRNLWEAIQTALNVNISFEDYATADDDIQSSDHLTEEQIVQQVSAEKSDEENLDSNESDDDNDPDSDAEIVEEPIKSTSEFLQLTVQLRAFLQKNKLQTKGLDDIEHLVLESKASRSKRQQSILSFFNK